MESTEPRRGEIWLVSLGAGREGEPGKNRPAVLISADELASGSPRDLCVVVPLSSSSMPSPLRPPVSVESGIDSPSVAMCVAVGSVSRRRLLRRIGRLDDEARGEIELALALVLGLD
jgi:mRNA interferase MazF